MEKRYTICKYSIMESLNKKFIDAIVVVGSDPVSSLPGPVLSHLASIPVICIDPCMTMTSKIATVTIPCAASGLESGGTAVRMDGKVIGLPKIIQSDHLTDEDILDRLMEAF